ncbi:mitochondrial Homoaconitase [Agyrium rufum]|nr:mitochondrial Homoaconitase [Agyrium rufum]
MAVASDSHTNMYGGNGCLGTAVVRTDAASIWATGKTWWQIPPIAKVKFTGQLPIGVTGKDVIVALCRLFSKDEVLDHAIECARSPETMASLPVDDRLAIANMTTEWGASTGLFPIDLTLQVWLKYRATEAALYKNASQEDASTATRHTHKRIDKIFANEISADSGAKYAKYLCLDLSTLAPYIPGPNSVKVATPLEELAVQNIPINKAYSVSYTNSRVSDLAQAAKVFKDPAVSNNGEIPKIADDVKFHFAASSLPEQALVEAAGDWQAMLDAGAAPLPAEFGISASNRNFKGRIGSTDAKAYPTSPEVVDASALSGKISGPGWYEKPAGWTGGSPGENDGIREEDRMITASQALEKVIGQLNSMLEDAEKQYLPSGSKQSAPTETSNEESLTAMLPGFPAKVTGEIVFCDAGNINTDGIHPGKYTYQDDVTPAKMAKVCILRWLSQKKEISSSRASTSDAVVLENKRQQLSLAKKIPLVVAGSFGNIFSRNNINNALMSVEVPRLVQRLRETFSAPIYVSSLDTNVTEPENNSKSLDSPPPAKQSTPKEEKALTRRTGWTFTWDVARSKVEVQEDQGGQKWSQKVGSLPPNVQEIIAKGGLEKWVK